MDQFEFAIQVLFLGFSVVIFTLFLLFGILLLFSRIFQTNEKPVIDTAPIIRTDAVKPGISSPDRLLNVAIIAAVYQYMSANSSYYKPGPVKISVQPTGESCGNNWHIIGRKLLLENKLELENIRRRKTS
jgi:Na+-transporting methylmalonyl-CoA/oxaloacetate decarboxylase gamma subunit